MAAPSDPLASLPSGVKLLLRSLHNLIPEKLTETNYPAWSLNVQTALSANLLLGWIDGHEAAPAPTISKNDKTVPNPEYTSWTIVDTQIRACLLADCGYLRRPHTNMTAPLRSTHSKLTLRSNLGRNGEELGRKRWSLYSLSEEETDTVMTSFRLFRRLSGVGCYLLRF
ncbi:unnamed protein product [Cuscuta campestris]|uniref:Retrotransposon Copia-like N-terminal domain-containing protein n=1 Tax=Cuscuta campestris TaxID=132261 RepID=A0A484MH53_9ASTE|nr:unnamed protein product [Cuscuta campestris]